MAAAVHTQSHMSLGVIIPFLVHFLISCFHNLTDNYGKISRVIKKRGYIAVFHLYALLNFA